MTTHTPQSLLAALDSTMQHLLDSTGCTTAQEVALLICEVFGAEHPEDAALYAALDKFSSIGHLEP